MISLWSVGDRNFEVTKTLDIKNANFAICKIAIQSQPLNRDHIWTVDHTPYRSFANHDLERQRTQCIKNADFAICEITIQSQPLNRDQIWTIEHTPYQSFANRDMEKKRTQCFKNVEIAKSLYNRSRRIKTRSRPWNHRTCGK
jgi:hypothetical protein